MADLLVSPLVDLLIEKLESAVTKELHLLKGLDKDMRKLQSTLSTISAVLEDAEMRSFSDKPLSVWLKKLKNAAYEADDVMDEFQTEALRRQAEKSNKLEGKVRDFFSPSHNPIIFRHKIAKQVKDVLESMNHIAELRINFHLREVPVSMNIDNDRETNSIVIESEVVGRASEKKEVLEFLTNADDDKNLSVLAIVGMGGLGKTTLAQLAYNDVEIKSMFDLQMWVCVSDEFDVKQIARKIIECVNKKKCEELEFEVLSRLLQETIGGKRFFLVLDDVWNEDRGKWERLRSLLNCGKKGSKIVTTTRSDMIATVMGNAEPLRLEFLSHDDCWTLFKERAFSLWKEKETPHLVKIGKQIVDKCGRLPLAVTALGSLMSKKEGESEWLAIRDSEIWNLADEGENILPSLRLSYYHLPPYLKQCFAYCSLFPKNFEFKKNKLINLWIGEGFVTSTNKSMSPEDIGNQYFNNLLSRSFFQERRKDIISFKMHDLVHDLACSIAKDECYMTLFHKEIDLAGNYRRLSLVIDSESPERLDIPCENLNLCSLILNDDYNRQVKEINWDVLLRQRHLRLLDIRGTSILTFPSTICRLQHLRFMNLSYSRIETLPKSIGRLYNLSTLILESCERLEKLPSTITFLQNLYELNLYGCSNLVQLPSGITNMSSLYHLNLDDCYRLSEIPTGIGRLTNLQALSEFIVGQKDGYRITELRNLNQIRGHLTISSLDKVGEPAEAKEANLVAKTRLKSLMLKWDFTEVGRNAEEEEGVIENLQPPPNLYSLCLSGYGGTRLTRWIVSSSTSLLLQNLVKIEMYGLYRCDCLPPLGHLPSLKRLTISQMDGLRKIGEEFYQHQQIIEAGCSFVPSPFPVLEELRIEHMCNLEEWVVVKEEDDEDGGADIIIKRENMFPSLMKLEIEYCPKLRKIHSGLPLSVVNLSITRSSSEGLISGSSLRGLSKVKSLNIWYIEESVLASSSFLEGLQYLTNLDKLVINICDGLRCLPEGLIQLHIPTLRSLEIGGFNNLTCLGSGRKDDNGHHQQQPPLLFTSLHHMLIRSCEELGALPEWIGCLTSLQSLMIRYCEKLQMLPDGFQRLTSLESLEIRYCTILNRRCERDTGEDWHKVAHIPNLRIFEQLRWIHQ